MSAPLCLRHDHDHFGACPICGCGGSEFRNIGRTHWFVCMNDRVRWYVGENLFSSWRLESESDWRANRELLATFREMEPERAAPAGLS